MSKDHELYYVTVDLLHDELERSRKELEACRNERDVLRAELNGTIQRLQQELATLRGAIVGSAIRGEA